MIEAFIFAISKTDTNFGNKFAKKTVLVDLKEHLHLPHSLNMWPKQELLAETMEIILKLYSKKANKNIYCQNDLLVLVKKKLNLVIMTNEQSSLTEKLWWN